MKLCKLALASLLATGALYAGNYTLDRAHSSVSFKVKHMMISSVKGKFGTFTGEIAYDEKSKTLTKLNGEIDVNSIDTDNAKRDGHLKSADFFDVKKYPKITFSLTKVDGDNAYGKLTMHGVTKDIKLDIDNGGVIKDPFGNQRLGFELEGKVNRTDFGLKYNSTLETGGVLIGEDVKIDIQIESILAK